MFEGIGYVVSKYPRAILLAWILIIVIVLPWSQRVNSVLSNDLGNPPASEANYVQQILNEEFANKEQETLFLTATFTVNSDDTDKLRPENWQEAQLEFEKIVDGLQNVDGVVSIIDNRSRKSLPSFSEQNSSSLAIMQINSHNLGSTAITVKLKQLLPQGELLSYYLTGIPAIDLTSIEISHRDRRRAELFGLPLSLIILLIAFGALVAALLPLLVALISISLSFALIFVVGQFWAVPTFVQTVVTMLGLAAGIDYALLMVNRFREELLKGFQPREAAILTTKTAGKAITLSGLTVIIALTALLIPPLTFVRSVGFACMIIIFFSVVISITALPALFCLLGKRIDLVSFSKKTLGKRSYFYWQRWAEGVLKRPLWWIAVGLLSLLILSYPTLSIQTGFLGVEGLAEDTDVHKAQAILTDLGLTNLIRSFEVILDFEEKGFFHPSSVHTVSKLTRNIESLNGVTEIYSPTKSGSLPRLFMQQYYATRELALQSPLKNLVLATVSTNGRYVLLQIFPRAGILPAESRQLVKDLREIIQVVDVPVFIGGSYALEHSWVKTLYQSFPYAIFLVYIITFVLLGLAFHSIIIPLKAIILNTLTVSAAFGVIVLIFQKGWFANFFGLSQSLGLVEASIPIFIFAIVFGLSMDYEVFLVTRIFENHQKGLSDREAVIKAISATGGVISSAALIMLVVFVVFIFSDLVLIKTLALGLSVAVFLDATLVRLALVPAVMLLAGKWNWWLPKSLERAIKKVNLLHD